MSESRSNHNDDGCNNEDTRYNTSSHKASNDVADEDDDDGNHNDDDDDGDYSPSRTAGVQQVAIFRSSRFASCY